jgi:glycosyltransferase involved in cell wall biosynthesis
VLGNALGAIPEHVRPGETGWLNRSCTAVELADLMAALIERPEEVESLRHSMSEARAALIEPFAVGLARLMDAYARVMAPTGQG